ncbi:MAG: cobalamin biosynthesis protein [Candidatus Adiutrix sp.]|jgi:cobalt-precorrin 5A hydrolase|nr:cobalamin biosynthesis protein [Candidatus Adiutrix sp.]
MSAPPSREQAVACSNSTRSGFAGVGPGSPPAHYAIYALTRPGAELAGRLARGLSRSGGADLYLPRRLEKDYAGQAAYFERVSEALAGNFQLYRGHLFVGAVGLAVRIVAPLLKSKKDDPAVVVLTQDGRFAVSLLSGHLGGANDLAREAARLTGGQAVVSTATDVGGLPALEVLARDHQLEIEDFSRLAAVSRCLVDGERVPLYDPGHWLWPHLQAWAGRFELQPDPPEPGRGPHLRVDYHLGAEGDPEALIFRPRVIALGLGCHRGLERRELEELIGDSLAEASLALKSVAVLASVASRGREPALLELSRLMGRPLITYSKEELGRIETPNPSGKVLERIGVASVCEAAAMLAARTDRLLISKRKSPSATLAAALFDWKSSGSVQAGSTA